MNNRRPRFRSSRNLVAVLCVATGCTGSVEDVEDANTSSITSTATGGPGECPDDRIDCGGECVDTNRDNAHCGACGAACGAGDRCVDGQCALDCQPALLECGGSCVDPMTNDGHCGGCSLSCRPGET